MRYWEIVEAGQRDADTEETDDDNEHERWKRYWAKQQRVNRALAADAEKRSRGLPTSASICRSEPPDVQPSGWAF